MSWTRNLATGKGAVGFRLQIEGLAYEFVSWKAAERTTPDGRQRINGLVIDDFILEEDADIAHGDVEASSITANIVDTLGTNHATKALSWAPQGRTLLTADIDALSTSKTMMVDSTDGLLADGVIHVGTEAMEIDSVDSSTQLTVTRQLWSTIAQAHYAGDGDKLAQQWVYFDRPPGIEGRRYRIMAYGEGDDPQGSGTQVWGGRCLTDAALGDDGATWTVHLGPTTDVLDFDMGAELEDPVSPRGIYYPAAAPLLVSIVNNGGYFAKAFAGHFESNQELVNEINDWFLSIIASTDLGRLRAIALGDIEWFIAFRLGGTVSLTDVQYQSPVDGFASTIRSDDGLNSPFIDPDPNSNWIARNRGGVLSVPRGVFGTYFGASDSDYSNAILRLTPEQQPDENDAPSNRVFLGGDVVPEAGDSASIEWEEGQVTHEVVDSDGSDRWIDVEPSGSLGLRIYHSGNLPEIKLQRIIATGGLNDLRGALVALSGSLTHANLGTMPFITIQDVNDWTAAIFAEDRAPLVVGRRVFAIGAEVSIKEYLAEECKLRGVFPHLDSVGRVTLSALRMPSEVERVDHVLTHDDVLIDDGFPTWERTARGSLNTARLSTGYNLLEDEYEGPRYVVRNVSAFTTRKKDLSLDIEPKSLMAEGSFPAPGDRVYEELVSVMSPVLGIFGSDYAVISVDVPLTRFDVLVGDTVSIPLPHLPNVRTGDRGDVFVGLVTGRSWDMRAGRGTLKVLVMLNRLAGWAPTVSVVSQSGIGTTWTLTVKTQDPLDLIEWWVDGDELTDHFAVGDRIRLRVWDEFSIADANDGEITSIDNDTMEIGVELDASWTPAASSWILEFDSSTDVDGATNQANYVFLGRNDGRVFFAGTGNRGAHVFAP